MGNYYKDDLIETTKDGYKVYGEVDKNGKPCGYAIISKKGDSLVEVTEDYSNHTKNGLTFVRSAEKIFHIAKYENDKINGICLERNDNIQSISFRKNGIIDGVVMYFPNAYSGDIIFALYENNVFTGKVAIYQKDVSRPNHRKIYFDTRVELFKEKFCHTAMNVECLQSQNSTNLNMLSVDFDFNGEYSSTVIDNNYKAIYPESNNLKTIGYIHCSDGGKYISELYKGRPNENFCKRDPNGAETYGWFYELINDFCGVKYYPDAKRYIFYNLDNDNIIRGLWIDIDEDYIWLKCNHYKGKSEPKQESDFVRIDKKTLELTRYNVKGEYLETKTHREYDWKNPLDKTEYDFSNRRVPAKVEPDLTKPNAKTMTSIVAPKLNEGVYPGFNKLQNKTIQNINNGFLDNYETEVINTRLYIKKVLKMEKTMIVPKGVHELKPNAFSTNEANILKEVILPSSLDYIGGEAFKNCTKLEKVDLSKTKINLLQLNVFENSGVKIIHFPESLKKLEVSAISYCNNIKKLELPGVEVVESYAISHCENLEEIILPKAKLLNYSAIVGCYNLRVVKIPKTCEVKKYLFSSNVEIKYI